jgi:hypothetical protein
MVPRLFRFVSKELTVPDHGNSGPSIPNLGHKSVTGARVYKQLHHTYTGTVPCHLDEPDIDGSAGRPWQKIGRVIALDRK